MSRNWMVCLCPVLWGVLIIGGGGCATTFNDSAPAKDGYVYVAGSYNNVPTVWLCPSEAGKGECKQITVKD